MSAHSTGRDLYHVDVLAEMLERFDWVDKDDQYQVYVLFTLLDAECHKCGSQLNLIEPFANKYGGRIPSREWVEEAAFYLRELGWQITPPEQGWYQMRALCSDCHDTRLVGMNGGLH